MKISGKRLVFDLGKQREIVLAFISYSGKSQLLAAKKLGVPRRSLRNWLDETRTFPAEIFEKMKRMCPSLTQFSRNICKVLDKDWGRAMGGKNCYVVLQEKYGEGELNRRRQAGGKSSIKKRLERIIEKMPSPKDESVLELLGALIGDGWIGISGGRKQVCFCGNLRQKNYARHLQMVLHRTFHVRGHLKFRRETTAFYIIINSGPMFDYFRNNFDFPVGFKNRFNTGRLPSEAEGAKSVLRGIFDTDGSIYFDNAEGYARPYPVVDITSHNPELLAWISASLTKKGFKVISLKYSIRLKTIGQVERWFNEIKPSNRTHIRKWNRWKSQYMGP